jgi:hypothetical protein
VLQRIATVAVMLAVAVATPAFGQAAAGIVAVDISSAVGQVLPARVDLVPQAGDGEPVIVRAERGPVELEMPAGSYTAYVYVYEREIPLMVGVKPVEVAAGQTAFVAANVVEGSGANPLRGFDRDGDLVVDRVELEQGTDPDDPADFPGAHRVAWTSRVLNPEAGWYRGDLHVRSRHGRGDESVADLVKRAEKTGLDFIAIADRNTMAAASDPAFSSSDRVVVLPAMEWGSNERGVGLVYGARTLPDVTDHFLDAQGVVFRVQSQGGMFAVAHPCFPTMPWQRGLGFINAVQVWAREWQSVPPITLEALSEEYRTRIQGRLVFSMSEAASMIRGSANDQAMVFWDAELDKGLLASPIGGSLSSSSKVPMGKPVTYVFAKEKSIRGILDGLRSGQTFLSSGVDGPKVELYADVLADDDIDVRMGGIIPVGVETTFYAHAINVKGMKVQVYADGLPIVSKTAEYTSLMIEFKRTVSRPTVFRAQVVAAPDFEQSRKARRNQEAGFSDLDVRALSAPIYARNMLILGPGMEPEDMWIKIRNTSTPPVFAEPEKSTDGRAIIHTDKTMGQIPQGEFSPPPDSTVINIEPEWRY